MQTFEPYLMILMRKDLASMTGGRAAAQASHATSHFTRVIEKETSAILVRAFKQWETTTPQYFGTTVVAGVSEKEMRDLQLEAYHNQYASGRVNDPTYGVRDGEVTHYVSVDTCVWIFVHTAETDLYSKLKQVPLF